MIKCQRFFKWRPTSLSELTPFIFDIELTHLSSEANKLFQYLLGNSLV